MKKRVQGELKDQLHRGAYEFSSLCSLITYRDRKGILDVAGFKIKPNNPRYELQFGYL